MAYKRILVPIDGSPTSGRGLREAIGFAKAQKARLQLVHVIDLHNAMLAGLSSGDTVRDLAAALNERGRRLLKRLVMGSDAEQIVRNAPVPVMLVRRP